jgi:hypothetical protein
MAGRLMNGEFETMWIENVVTCLKVLLQHLPWWIERISDEPKSVWSMFQPRL